ncbi:hypothetical protein [Pantoea sp. 1.19]|uniref:hypothetical protein n=1 Tax=Pantoea sp. 1.19 TaxID=1925589 RepID=UPI00111531FE|nr:hypothetical protein [Pantoea sp. 1.19]
MKAFKCIVGLFFLSLITPTITIASGLSCMETSDKKCDFIAKTKGNDIYIYVAEKNTLIFSIPEIESAVETIDFLKKGSKYMLIREVSNSNKTKEVLSFNSKLNDFSYLYLTSDIDFNQNEKYWHGIYCESSNISISESVTSPFEWAFVKICKKHSETHSEYKYVGSDLYFSLDSVLNGVVGKMQLIALNAKDSDNMNIANFGCLENCPSYEKFTGKIDNKYVIKMSLNIDEGRVEGSYYYDRVKKNIPLIGRINKNKIILNVKGRDGEIEEVFSGVVDGNIIGGTWNKKNNTLYNFIIYRSLIE